MRKKKKKTAHVKLIFNSQKKVLQKETFSNWNPYGFSRYREVCLHPVLYHKLFSRDSRSEWMWLPEEMFTCEFVLGVWMLCPLLMSKMCKCPSCIPPPTARMPACQGHQSMAFKVPNNHTDRSASEKVNSWMWCTQVSKNSRSLHP